MSGKRILVLFDVDGTLTEPRGEATEEVKEFLTRLKTKTAVGIVGGSDLVKQQEQMGKDIVNEVDYSFSENGLVAYHQGRLIGKEVRKSSFTHDHPHPHQLHITGHQHFPWRGKYQEYRKLRAALYCRP